MKYSDIIELLSISEEDNLILEFANFEPEEHKLGSNLKMHIMQPGDKKLQHGPRIKLFNNESDFTITISSDINKIKVIGNYANLISDSTLKKIKTNAVKYSSAFLKFWNDPLMTTKALLREMKKIDNNLK